jgi:nucleotide-binding universal stress UspA family protein
MEVVMEDSDSIDRILIATDGSPGALAAVEEGVRLAQIRGAGVTFVAVAHPPLPVLGDAYYQRALSDNLGIMRAALAKAIPYAEERRVTYETELLEGSPAKAILALAHSRDVDLIVVGSRGLGAVKGALLGSVSSAIVHHSDRPVLVARPIDQGAKSRLSRIAV